MLTTCLVLGVGLGAAAPGAAQSPDTDPQYVPTEQETQSEQDDQGVDGMLSLSANINLTSNKDVVGQPNGFSTLFGLGLTGGLDYVSGKHEWRNTLTVHESWARTPSLEQFVKNNDSLDIESLYNYFVLDWTGAYGRLNLETTLFETNSITAEPSDYVVQQIDGGTETFTGVTQFELASPFEPFSLFESFGWFAEPVRETEFSLTARAGLGARETFSKGVIVVQDDANSEDVLEAVELDNVFQAGLEGFVGVDGAINEGRVSYDVGFTTLLPLLNNDPQNRSAGELLRYGLQAGLTFNAFDWMSANYNLKVLRDPQLLDATQIQNNFLITFKYAFIERDKGSKKSSPPPLDKQLEKAKENKKQAEDKIESIQKKMDEEKKAEEAAEEAEDSPDTGENGASEGDQ